MQKEKKTSYKMRKILKDVILVNPKSKLNTTLCTIMSNPFSNINMKIVYIRLNIISFIPSLAHSLFRSVLIFFLWFFFSLFTVAIHSCSCWLLCLSLCTYLPFNVKHYFPSPSSLSSIDNVEWKNVRTTNKLSMALLGYRVASLGVMRT